MGPWLETMGGFIWQLNSVQQPSRRQTNSSTWCSSILQKFIIPLFKLEFYRQLVNSKEIWDISWKVIIKPFFPLIAVAVERSGINKPGVCGNRSLTRESFPPIMLSICTKKYNTKGARHRVLIIYGPGYCSALSSALHPSNEISFPLPCPVQIHWM